MNWEPSLLVLLMDVSIKSVLLAITAVLALKCLRIKNANTQHRVWTVVLLGMLALPFLIPVIPTVPIPSDWLSSPSNQIVQTGVTTFSRTTSVQQPPEPATLPKDIERGPSSPAISSLPLENQRFRASKFATSILTNWRSLACTVYLIGLGLFLLRLVLGLAWTRRLVSKAKVLPASNQHELAGINTNFSAPVYTSGELRVPITVGFLRPRILLPSEWRSWSSDKLVAVLTHESAHVERKDNLVRLLAEFNRAVYWFHPLSWLMRKTLADLAEHNCDDAVIESTGGRTQYARHLLDFASSLNERGNRIAWSGIAMARKANVETRIHAILDNKRPLAKRIGFRGALLLVAVAVPTILLAAAIKPAPGETDSSTTTDNDGADSQTIATRFRGRILAPDGSGQANATIYVVSSTLEESDKPMQQTILANRTTGKDGQFDFTVQLPPRDENLAGRLSRARYEQVIATANNLGTVPSDIIDVRNGKDLQLKLPGAETIQGRVIDTEGNPVAGATIRVLNCATPYEGFEAALTRLRKEAGEKQGMVDGFVVMSDWTEANPGRDFKYQNERIVGSELRTSSVGLPPPVQTDAQGRFTFPNIARDRMLRLSISGPGIVNSSISVASRVMDPIKSAYHKTRPNITYSTQFIYTVEPSQIVEGTIVDATTREPLPGITVESISYRPPVTIDGKEFQHRGEAEQIRVTDKNGRYRLLGLPKEKRRALKVNPADMPYLHQYVYSNDNDIGLAKATIDIQLKSTQWIEGRVTNQRTGEPVMARVVYVPGPENQTVEKYAAFKQQQGRSIADLEFDDYPTIVQTKQDGTYRVPGIAGKGVVFATTIEPHYSVARGKKTLPANWLKDEYGQETATASVKFYPQWVNVMQLIDVKLGETTRADLSVAPGREITVTLQDNTGQPLPGVVVRGQYASSIAKMGVSSMPHDTPNITLYGIDRSNSRSILFHHKEKKLAAYLFADQSLDVSTVRLQPCGTLKGRLVRPDGKPPTVHMISVRDPRAQNPELIPIGKPDAEGRFETDSFVSNTTFELLALERKVVTLRKKVSLKPGEVVDLGEIELPE